MQWYYSAAGQQQGPVSQAELEALARSGTVTPETLVWRDGMPNWAAWSSVAPALPAAGIPGVGLERCAECGQTFPKDSMVAFERVHICVSCKPIFFQKLKEGAPAGTGSLWRKKKQLIAPLGPVLPARCVKCNAPTDSPQKKRNLYWHHPAVYLALLLRVIPYVILALILRKRTTVMVSICARHRAARRNAIIIAWLTIVVGFLAIVFGIARSNDYGWVAGVGILLFLGGMIFGIVKGRLIYATKIDKERVWVGGCGKDFLAEFPEWSGP